jgi:hypothetical protein
LEWRVRFVALLFRDKFAVLVESLEELSFVWDQHCFVINGLKQLKIYVQLFDRYSLPFCENYPKIININPSTPNDL